MQRLAFASLLALGAESVLAHPGGTHAAQHGIEHLILALLFVVPAFMLLRRITRGRQLPQQTHDRNRRT